MAVPATSRARLLAQHRTSGKPWHAALAHFGEDPPQDHADPARSRYPPHYRRRHPARTDVRTDAGGAPRRRHARLRQRAAQPGALFRQILRSAPRGVVPGRRRFAPDLRRGLRGRTARRRWSRDPPRGEEGRPRGHRGAQFGQLDDRLHGHHHGWRLRHPAQRLVDRGRTRLRDRLVRMLAGARRRPARGPARRAGAWRGGPRLRARRSCRWPCGAVGGGRNHSPDDGRARPVGPRDHPLHLGLHRQPQGRLFGSPRGGLGHHELHLPDRDDAPAPDRARPGPDGAAERAGDRAAVPCHRRDSGVPPVDRHGPQARADAPLGRDRGAAAARHREGDLFRRRAADELRDGDAPRTATNTISASARALPRAARRAPSSTSPRSAKPFPTATRCSATA